MPTLPQNHNDQKIAQKIKYWRYLIPWILGPIIIGIVAVALAYACDYAFYLHRRFLESFPLAPILTMPIGFALIAYLVKRFFRGAQGSGIPQVIAVVDDEDPVKKTNLLSIRIAIGKVLMLLLGLFFGASIGREGPSVQIGGSIMHAFFGKKIFAENDLDADHRRALVVAGGAAGLAAAFYTPLAGVMFAIEELGKKHLLKGMGTTTLTVILAGLTSLAIVGNYTYFGSTSAYLRGFSDTHVLFICGILGGITGGLFSLAMIRMATNPPKVLFAIKNNPVIFAAMCGVLLALLGLCTNTIIFGSGYEATRETIASDSAVYAWYYGPAKWLATLISGISGIPGGMLAPALSVGAGIGDTLSTLWPNLAPHGAIVLLVMAGHLTAVTRSPLTSLIVTMEMTNGLHLLLPLMIVVLISAVVSRLITGKSMYDVLSEKLVSPVNQKITETNKENT